MTTVLLDGRRLPPQDWEGDDYTPGAGGAYVTCTDTATGRMISFATNGRREIDGRRIRAAVRPPDPNGITLPQAKQATKSLTGLDLVIPGDWHWAEVLNHLRARRGLVVQGWYSMIPRQYRFQLGADFGHAMWLSHFSPTAGNMFRNWDPLDPNLAHHGSWIPASAIRASMEELSRRNGTTHLYCAYIPLQPL
jgi:hypothetical protein